MGIADVMKIAEDLQEPYREAIQRAVVFTSGSDKLLGLSVIIAGPKQSGKTTDANNYARVLAEAGIVENKAVVKLEGSCIDRSPEWLDAQFKAAEGGVLIIDAPRLARDVAASRALECQLMRALDEGSCVVIMTGRPDDMGSFLQACPPELRTRLPETIETKPLTKQEIAEQEKLFAEKARLRQETAARERSVREWTEMAEDVTLRRAVKPSKGIVLMRRNDTVS